MGDSKRKRVQRTRAEIAEILDAFDRSGLSATRFAAANDLPISTFRLWLRRRAEETPRAKPSAFVPVTVAETEPTASGRIEIELGNGRRVVVTSGVDPKVVAALLPVVDDACS